MVDGKTVGDESLFFCCYACPLGSCPSLWCSIANLGCYGFNVGLED